MPVISAQKQPEKDRFKIEINSDTAAEIKKYMQWADIKDLSFFFEEAASFVLSKDKEWKQHKKKQKQAHTETV
ncbi:hypothetical protein FOG18_13850 (plasmid) [Legionella israelensis]|uniref:hypothetical protein n=1 Tax=Legionella israelensis TaxID=454 RepID=UPI00117C7A99|nr:hypothetical protein [Legionella israelensis]QDP73737.1 hypothetical protein FOG18_13850 [Legionella israelensis]